MRAMEAAALPTQAHSLVGRGRELEALTRAIEGGARLLTVTGPGGVGKTRLVEEGLAALRASHGEMVPVVQVDLNDVDGVAGLVDRVLDALGGSGRQRDLTKLLAQRAPVVLVLDPFDRLVRAAGVLSEWLRAVPSLALLVVSRQVLRSPEEVVLEVAPISDDATGVALFESIARRHRPGFALTEADRPIAAEIVRALDGLPLAIELAATRMAVMSPAALLHRLSNRFEVLRRGSMSGGRHVTLEASIAWSVELLGPAARETLAQCTVFRGGFSLEAAEAVVSLDGTPVLDVLQSLRERSLLTVSEPSASGPRVPGEVRLQLGQSVRAFIEPSLGAAAREAAEDRHATYYVRHAEEQAAGALARDGWRARARIVAERDNLLAVVERILGRPNVSSRSADRALRALVALGPVLLREGALEICSHHLERGLAVAQGSGADPRLQARSLALRAEVERRVGDLAGAEKDLAATMVLAHHTGEVRVEARALVLAAGIAIARREPTAAEAALARAEALARQGADELLSLACLGARGALELHARDLASAELRFEEGLARARRAGDPPAEIAFARRLAYVELALGRIAAARERLEAARALAREAHEPRAEVITAAPLALAMALSTGASDRYAAPLALLDETVRRAAELGLVSFEPAAKALLGCLHAARGERGEARLLLGEVTSSNDATSARLPDVDVLCLLALARIEAHGGRRDPARKLVQRATSRSAGALDGALAAFLEEDPLALDSAHRSPLVSLLLAIPATSSPLGSVPPPADVRPVLGVGPGATWFRVASEPRVDLSKRKPLRLILDRLAAERERSAGPLSWDDLLTVGWPGERMRADAGAHRVRVAISTLRKMGLRDVLRTEEDGYRIDPTYEVARAG
jgi:predicted ATPase